MKRVTYVLIPGLWDQMWLFGWFYVLVARSWSKHGMPAVVCQMKWVSFEPYKTKERRLRSCIEGLRQQGREVVLVGVSAGGPMAVLGLAVHSEVAGAVSISGMLRLRAEQRRNRLLMRASWFAVADRAERTTRHLPASRKRRILTISGRSDDLIKPQQAHIRGARSQQVRGWSHLPTVVRIMLVHRTRIRHFVRELESPYKDP